MYGAPFSKYAKKMMLLGAGELGKEVIIEAQRLGIETIAVDRYPNAPAMQVAHRYHVINMLDPESLRSLIMQEKPDWIVPEIESLATSVLVELEKEGFRVVPTAIAAKLTMDREGIRRLAAETLNIPTARYEFANSLEELRQAVEKIGTPCVIKPIMSSSGKGQSICRTLNEVEQSWKYALVFSRAVAQIPILVRSYHADNTLAYPQNYKRDQSVWLWKEDFWFPLLNPRKLRLLHRSH